MTAKLELLVGVLTATIAVASCQQGGDAAAGTQPAARASRSIPTFRVDADWPLVPEQWRLGDVSSVALDADDNAWLLHRPRTLRPEDAHLVAPAVIGFDRAGSFLRAWGGAGEGYEWPQREHGLHIDRAGFAWIGGNNCPARNLPGLEPVFDDQLLKFALDGKFVMQLGRSNASHGNADTENLHEPADAVVYAPTMTGTVTIA